MMGRYALHPVLLAEIGSDLLAGLWLLLFVAGFAFLIRASWRRRHNPEELAREKRQFKGICPICGFDLRSGHTLCPECGGPGRERRIPDPGRLDRAAMLRDSPLGPVPQAPATEESMEAVYETDSPVDAMMLAQYLEAIGIACRLEGDLPERDPTGQTGRTRCLLARPADRDHVLAVVDRYTRPEESTGEND
jgi:hypothetical protein